MIQPSQIRSAMAALNLRQYELAKALGVCRQTVGRLSSNGRVALEIAARAEAYFRSNGVRFSDEGGVATVTIEKPRLDSQAPAGRAASARP